MPAASPFQFYFPVTYKDEEPPAVESNLPSDAYGSLRSSERDTPPGDGRCTVESATRETHGGVHQNRLCVGFEEASRLHARGNVLSHPQQQEREITAQGNAFASAQPHTLAPFVNHGSSFNPPRSAGFAEMNYLSGNPNDAGVCNDVLRPASVAYVKPRVCKFYGMGMCNRGMACKYAHSDEDLRSCPQAFPMEAFSSDDGTGDMDAFNNAPRSEVPLMPFRLPEHEFGEGAVIRPVDNGFASNYGINTPPCLGTADDSCFSPVPGPPLPGSAQPMKKHPLHEPQPRPRAGKGAVDQAAKGEECIFWRTKMCKFYAAGICNKGRTCRFAHNDDERRPIPNLLCTKVCSKLVNTGSCSDLGCKYAHSKAELRKLKHRVTYGQNGRCTLSGGASDSENFENEVTSAPQGGLQ